jgi:hypothetical protein
MNPYIYLIPLAVLIGCAGVHKGAMLISTDKTVTAPIAISAFLNQKLSSEYFGYFDFTLENKTDKWVVVKNISILFPDSMLNDNIKVVAGRDITLWHEGYLARNAVNQYNKGLALGAFSVAAGVASAAVNDQTAKTVLAGASVLPLVTLSVAEVSSLRDSVERSGVFPANHLLTGDIRIPPSMFTRKFLLLNSTNHKNIPFVQSFLMTWQTDSGETFKMTANFRKLSDYYNHSWQRSIYKRTAEKQVRE